MPDQESVDEKPVASLLEAIVVVLRRCRYGPYVAALVTTLLFALLHLQAGIPWISVLAGVFSSGMIFAAIFARWRSVPLALGFHVATNIVQDASGLRTSAASLFALSFPPTGATAGTLTLGSVALVNLLLAAGILMSARAPASPTEQILP